jgi:hypothetical protein
MSRIALVDTCGASGHVRRNVGSVATIFHHHVDKLVNRIARNQVAPHAPLVDAPDKSSDVALMAGRFARAE